MLLEKFGLNPLMQGPHAPNMGYLFSEHDTHAKVGGSGDFFIVILLLLS